MGPLNIITVPNKVLTRTARRIQPGDIDLQELQGQMAELMHERGVGLAAPQVGLGLRFFVAMDPETHELRGYVNPQITWTSNDTKIAPEGCLSIPGKHAFVERFLAVRLKFQDIEFNEHEEEYQGWYARIVQHEYDHLNGVLISDRAVDGMHDDVEDDETEEVMDETEMQELDELEAAETPREGS
jgi:peptide deformylase